MLLKFSAFFYDKVGQARKGACILNLLAHHLSFRFIEAPFRALTVEKPVQRASRFSLGVRWGHCKILNVEVKGNGTASFCRSTILRFISTSLLIPRKAKETAKIGVVQKSQPEGNTFDLS